MNRRLWIIVSIVLAASFAMSACGVAADNGRSHGSRNGITNETNTDVYTFDVKESAARLTLELELTATQGTYTWTVTDPNGEIAWEGSLEAPDGAKQQMEFDVIPGEWTLEVAMENVTGSYDIEWRSR